MKKALILGASKNIGRGIAEQLAQRDWEVIGTVRQSAETQLHTVAAQHPNYSLRIEHLDVLNDQDIASLHDKLANEKFDLILFNAGIARGDRLEHLLLEDFIAMMTTNAFAPLHNIQSFADLLAEHGTLAVTSSALGSFGLNRSTGGSGAYDASKSALNRLMQNYADLHPEQAIIMIEPGWTRTDLDPAGGNAIAPLSVEESTSGIINMLEKHLGEVGIQFRSYKDEELPW